MGNTSYAYWVHKKTEETFAVFLAYGKVLSSLGPLAENEHEHRAPDEFSHNMTSEDNDWLNEHAFDFEDRTEEMGARDRQYWGALDE